MATTYQSYDDAAQVYLARFRALRAAPAAPAAATTRGLSEVASGDLIGSASEIAEVSAALIPLAGVYLNSPDPAQREGISGQLLAQAAAEMQVATELLQIAADEAAGAGTAVTRAPREVTRAAPGAGLRAAIDELEKAMAVPVSAGLLVPGGVRRGARAADTPQAARDALRQAAVVTAGSISQRVIETGGDLAFNLVFNTEWSAVAQSAGLLSSDIGRLLDRIKEGASDLIQRAITAAVKTVLNVYDKILALLGRDVEDEARKRIKAWLDEIQKAGKIELFEQLVSRLYQVDTFQAVLPGWLEKTSASVDTINATAAEVAVLSDKFSVLVGRINTLGDVVGLSKFIQTQFPQVLAIATALRVALLALLVYEGYDYIGFGQGAFFNLTRGVGEVIRENLGVVA